MVKEEDPIEVGDIPAVKSRWADDVHEAVERPLEENLHFPVILPEDSYSRRGEEDGMVLLAVVDEAGNVSSKHRYVVREEDL